MKTSLFLLFGLLALLMVSITPGCDPVDPPKTEDPADVPVELASMNFAAPRSYILQDGVDTLTNADTLDLNLGTFYGPTAYQIQVSADSLSGSTAATTYLELDSDGDGVGFYRIETMTINGVTSRLYETGTILFGTLRLRTIQGGTQVNRIWQEFCHSPRIPN